MSKISKEIAEARLEKALDRKKTNKINKKTSFNISYRDGLTNGNGLTNGMVNGFQHFNNKSKNELKTGLINGNGLTNGNGLSDDWSGFYKRMKFQQIAKIKVKNNRRKVLISILGIIILILPLFLFMTEIPTKKGMVLDGEFEDWSDIENFKDKNELHLENENINLKHYKSKVCEDDIFLYFQVRGRLFSGIDVNNVPQTIIEDDLFIFCDTDNDINTGYYINYIGADYLARISGHSNQISTSNLFYFDNTRKEEDWNGWKLLTHIPTAQDTDELEFKIPLRYISNYNSDEIIFYGIFKDSLGNEDHTDTIFAQEQEILHVNSKNITPKVILGREKEIEMLVLEFNSINDEVDINKIVLNRTGSILDRSISRISIWEDFNDDGIIEHDSDILLQRFTEPFKNGKGDLSLDQYIKINKGTTKKIIITADFSYTFTFVDSDTINIALEKPGGIRLMSGLVSYQYNKISDDAQRLSYLGNVTSEIVIDGAFGDWNLIRSFKDDDVAPIRNNNVDIDEYKFTSDNTSISFYCSVRGTMMGGTDVPVRPSLIKTAQIVDPGPRFDIEPEPEPGNDENKIKPDVFESSKRIPELIGEDTICVFIDSDNDIGTGYSVYEGSGPETKRLGSDFMLKITGKNGVVSESDIYSFSGITYTSWSWSRISPLTTGHDNKRLETQIGFNILNYDFKSDVSIMFIANDWNNDSKDYTGNQDLLLFEDQQTSMEDEETDSRGGFVLIEKFEKTKPKMIEILNDFQIDILESYSSFYLINVTAIQMKLLKNSGFSNMISRLPQRTEIDIGSTKFDTTFGEPELDEKLSINSSLLKKNSKQLFIIQFIGPIKQSWLEVIEYMDVEILYYIPNYAYLVRMEASLRPKINEQHSVEWIGVFQPAYKISDELLKKIEDSSSIGNQYYTMTIQKSDGFLQTIDKINNITRINNIMYDSYFENYNLILELNSTTLLEFLRYNDVVWVEDHTVPKLSDETATEIVGGFWADRIPWDGPGNFVNSLGWNGTNVTVAVADSGIGNGTAGATGHVDFGNRVIGGTQYGSLSNWVDGNAHGTHVSGIVAGDGYSGSGEQYPTTNSTTQYYVGMGMAPEANLYAQRIFSSTGGWSGPSSWDTFFQDAYNSGCYIHQNSWGENPGDSAYETYDIEYDQAVRDSATSTTGDQQMIVVVAAGNSGSSLGTIQSPASGKNVISVGATENYYPDAGSYGLTGSSSSNNISQIAPFSSRGFEDDSRIKPDIMAPGTNVLSARSPSGSSTLHGVYSQNSTYLWCSGTSQACPHVSGAAANIVDWWQVTHNGAKPSPALVKAMLINTAVDIGTPDRPNAVEGWGRMYLPAIFDPPADMFFIDQDKLLTTGSKSTYEIYVTSTDQPLNITLVWTDPAAASLANPALVNNLDLKLTAPDRSTVYYGNVFKNSFSTPGKTDINSIWDTDSDGFDERNNVECIFITNSSVQRGYYKLEIIADNIATDAVSSTGSTDQDFALVISGDLWKPNDVGIDNIKPPKNQPINKSAEIIGTVKNFGKQNQTTPFNVRCIIDSPKGIEVLNSTQTVSSIASFTTKNYTWNYTPTVKGKYIITMLTELSIDDVMWNNVSITSMMVPEILGTIATFTGVNGQDRFGWNVSTAGDVNYDGISDIIIGAPYNDSADGSLSDAGAAYIFYGPKNGSYSALNADVKLYGTAANDHFGWDVSGLGDINGTFDDLIIGAPGNSSTAPGKAYVFDGRTVRNDQDGTLTGSDADITITGGANGDRFGSSVAGMGDVNNDSYMDILIGAYLNDTLTGTLSNAGMAYLFLGNTTLTGNIDVTSAVLNLSGQRANDNFGFSVSFAGDMNNDNFDDIVIGSPGIDRSYIYFGEKDIGLGGFSSFLFQDGFESGGFNQGGWSLSSPPPVVSTTHPRTGNYAAGGRVSIFGATTNTYTFEKTIDTTGFQNIKVAYSVAVQDSGPGSISFVASYSTNGGTSWTDFESAITDNNNIYAVKNWDLTSVQAAANNQEFMIRFSGTFGGNTQSTANCFWVDDVNVNGTSIPGTAMAVVTIEGENSGDSFGWAVNSSGNVNGDAYSDIVIGAPNYGDRSGRAYVVHGSSVLPNYIPAGTADVIISAGSGGDKFGYSVGSSDLGSDGFSDILVGAPFNDSLDGSRTDAGAVYVFNGSSELDGIINGADLTRSGENAFDHFGWAVSDALDMNNDTYFDLLVGAPHYDNGTLNDVGKSYILTSAKVIPEFNEIMIPIILMSVLMMIFKSIVKR